MSIREVIWKIVTNLNRSTPPPHIQGTDSIHTSEDISLYARHHGKLTDEGKHKLLTWDWSPHAGLTSMCSHGQEHTIAPFSLHG
ncbi:hypothetical protein DPMN_041789 [Dreissena polymorpha]|uniref:Uncharacterized protein n=1 Tax=Dreissena polymorpha TaxID=45954 RepID=A0A9D4HWE3_DREPO|nr:hypothetical protein DPMN_041789 [Dreissena polymorpha]